MLISVFKFLPEVICFVKPLKLSLETVYVLVSSLCCIKGYYHPATLKTNGSFKYLLVMEG